MYAIEVAWRGDSVAEARDIIWHNYIDARWCAIGLTDWYDMVYVRNLDSGTIDLLLWNGEVIEPEIG